MRVICSHAVPHYLLCRTTHLDPWPSATLIPSSSLTLLGESRMEVTAKGISHLLLDDFSH